MADMTLADMLRGGIEGFDDRRRSLPGMKLGVDPSVFILGGEALSVEPPPEDGFVVGGVMRLAQSGRHSFRLYPLDALTPPGDRFVEVAEEAGGPVVRVFSAVHVVSLADRAAEAAWTLPPDGKIGPEIFPAPDGTPYRRDGAPGWQTAMTRYGQLDRAEGADRIPPPCRASVSPRHRSCRPGPGYRVAMGGKGGFPRRQLGPSRRRGADRSVCGVHRLTLW